MHTRITKKRAQRRYLTALFSDLCDSTALAATADPEEFADLLDELERTCEQTIRKHGGSILQVRGDGIFAVFGLEAEEDAARRATEAAIDLHAVVKNIPCSMPLHNANHLTMHTGIHSSFVLAVEGNQVSGKYTLVGDAGNIASKLSDLAEPDEILVSETTLDAYRKHFQVSDRRDIQIKNLDRALVVHTVDGRKTTNTGLEVLAQQGLSPLIGRSNELQILGSALEKSQQGRSYAVSIIGSPGIGKTRLAEDFLNSLSTSDCLVLRSFCESYLHAEPLQPVLQMLRGLLDLESLLNATDEVTLRTIEERLTTIDASLSQYAEVIAQILYPIEDRKHPGDTRIVTAIAAIAKLLTRDRTLVVFVDDWQWADDSTRSILRNAPELLSVGLLLVKCSREQSPDDQTDEVVQLQPLPQDTSTSLIENLVDNADQVQIDEIVQAAGGNPLYIEELCHAQSKGYSQQRNAHWQTALVPDRLIALISSRMAYLNPTQRALLEKLAIIGNVIPNGLIDRISEEHDTQATIAQLEILDFVYPLASGDNLRFKHGVTRDVVLDSMDNDKRQGLHLKIAQAIEERYPGSTRSSILEALAYHYGNTNEHVKAADYAEAAGDKALAGGTTDRVRVQYLAALTALDRDKTQDHYERWVLIAKRLAIACLFDAHPSQQSIYQQLVERAKARRQTADQIDGEYWLAYVNYALGNAPTAMLHIDRAKILANEHSSATIQTQILSVWGQTRALACEYEPASDALDEALARQAPFKKNRNVGFAYAYSLAAKSMVLGDQGYFEEAFHCIEEAETLTQGPVHPVQGSIVSMKTAVLLWQGDWESALDSAKHNIDIGRQTGSRYITAAGNALAGYARWQLDPKAGIETVTRSLAWLEGNHQTIWTSLHFSWLCEMLVAQGNYQEARRAAVWVLQRARKKEILGESVVYCALAEIPDNQGQTGHAAADRCFFRAYKSAEKRLSTRECSLIHYKKAKLYQKSGNVEGALGALAGCKDSFSTLGMYAYAAKTQSLELALRKTT